MDLLAVKQGLRVRITHLEPTTGMFVPERRLAVRAVGVTGTVAYYVAGHGGDVWWVEHDDCDDVGAYLFTEFEPL